METTSWETCRITQVNFVQQEGVKDTAGLQINTSKLQFHEHINFVRNTESLTPYK